MAASIRILVVDDSAFARRAVERMLSGLADVEVVGTATDGEEAVQKTRELRPDVVTMDIMMPKLNGLEALRRIMEECPTAVLIMSTLAREEAEITVRALELGAVDVIDKTRAGTAMELHMLAPEVQEKVIAAAGANLEMEAGGAERIDEAAGDVGASRASPPHARGVKVADDVRYELVAIGASTGGPRALFEVLPALPADFGAGVIVAQHMPASFTTTLAERLDRACMLDVSEAEDGDSAAPGRVLIAPGGKHVEVERSDAALRVRVHAPEDEDVLHHPSIDVLLDSVARVVGRRAVGVVLTGMGDDGAEGIRRLREAGGRTLVESSSTAVINGMPRAARPSADEVVPLGRVADAIVGLCAGEPARNEEER